MERGDLRSGDGGVGTPSPSEVIYVSALLFMPLGGTIGTFLGMYSARQDEKFLLAIIGGSISWAIALLVPIGTLGPVSSFEKKE